MATANPRVLLVDDEPAVLEGIQRLLRKQYEITLASDGEAALAAIDDKRPFAVVVSDMRMPGMNGAQLLARFHARAPDTVRMLLTGQADLDVAISAVNEGQLFRFLTKPCPHELFAPALAAAVEQHRLLTSEKVLLEQTLTGTTRALTEMLSLLAPGTFAAATRQHERVREVASRLGMKDAWQAEIASMLSSFGYAVLPEDVLRRHQAGAALEESESAMLSRVPEVVDNVLKGIPRLESIREILREQRRPFSARRGPIVHKVPLGARILRAVTDFGLAEVRLKSAERALSSLRDNAADYDPEVLAALSELYEAKKPKLEALALHELRIGMKLAEDVRTRSGMLLVGKGQRVTLHLLDRLRNYHQRVGVVEPIPCEVDGAS